MADLYLHIGAPKTGTSAIQAFLAQRREALDAQGVLYPKAGRIGGAHHLLGAAIFPVRAKRLRADAGTVLGEVAADFREEVAAAAPRTIVLSSEYLWGETTPEAVRRLLEPFAEHRLHLIVYLRRQDLLAQSIYTQAVKGGAVRTFHDWMASEADTGRAGLHFDRVLAAWRTCGLPVTIHVRVYERGQIDADVTHDFLSIVCPEVTFDKAVRAVNTSPDRITVELMRRLNRVLDEPAATSVRRRIAGAARPRDTFAPIDFLDGAAAAAFLARFADGNARIARDLLDRADGVLFRDPVDPAIESRPVNGTAMLDALIERLPDMLAKTAPARPDDDESEDEPILGRRRPASDQSGVARAEKRSRRLKRLERKQRRDDAAGSTAGSPAPGS